MAFIPATVKLATARELCRGQVQGVERMDYEEVLRKLLKCKLGGIKVEDFIGLLQNSTSSATKTVAGDLRVARDTMEK